MSKLPPNQHIPSKLTLTDSLMVQAAQQFGTPLYLYDAALMRRNWDWLQSVLPDSVTVYYSVKANPNIWIVDLFLRFEACFEVASTGEMHTVLRTGASNANIIFVGPGKTKQELETAILSDLQAIVVESVREVEEINGISIQYGKKSRIVLRINPGRGKGTISMGGATQFGMEPDVALSLLSAVPTYPGIIPMGIHTYLGTGILDWKVVLNHTQMAFDVAASLQEKSGTRFCFVDVGGGMGIPYHDRDEEPNWAAMKDPLDEICSLYLSQHPWTKTIAFEAGRFLIGSAGVFLATVVDVKNSGGHCFVILDGGTNVFGADQQFRGFRPTPIRVLGRDRSEEQPITLCGPLCTSIDRLAADILLPTPRVGDIIAFYQAGAYGYTASPGLFLSHGYPCEVLYDGKSLRLVRQRITAEHILERQLYIPGASYEIR